MGVFYFPITINASVISLDLFAAWHTNIKSHKFIYNQKGMKSEIITKNLNDGGFRLTL